MSLLNQLFPRRTLWTLNSHTTREALTVAVESHVFPHVAAEWPMFLVKSTQHKKKEPTDDHKARKATETEARFTKTKAAKTLSEAGNGLTQSQATVSIGHTVTNYINGLIYLGTPVLVPVYSPTGKMVL